MSQYREMDINARINLKGTYESFLKIAVEKFQKSQERKIYNSRKRYVVGEGNRARVRYYTRTRNLYKQFGTGLSMYDTEAILNIDFLLYGRFVDMGVGGNTGTNEVQLKRRYREHRKDIKRTPRRWYSKTRASQEKRLAEILKEKYAIGMVGLVENMLSQTVQLN